MIPARTFPIRLQGQWLECRTPQDAVAVQRAGDIISELVPPVANDQERVDLTLALFRYGRYKAAVQLRWRMRLASA
jgi:hypothetical protein